MATVTNKTRRPLRVPLPGGKTLHLGPGKSGQISSKNAEHAGVKKLVEDSAIEIIEDDARHTQGRGNAGTDRPSAGGHEPGRGSRRSGDR